MYQIRDVFYAKPGKAKELVKLFKAMTGEMERSGIKNVKILTDSVSSYWTVIIESEVEDLNSFLNVAHNASKEVMKGNKMKEETRAPSPDYRDLITGGYREIFRVE